MVNTKEQRIEIVNQIIKEISTRGRKFFFEHYGVAKIYEKNKRLYMINEYNGKHMCLSTKYGRSPKGWTHGGTLWGLTKDFKDYIMTGKKKQMEKMVTVVYIVHIGVILRVTC